VQSRIGNAVYRGKPEAGALAKAFGGEKGLEYFFENFIVHTASVVADD
jgi:hypothetical protein